MTDLKTLPKPHTDKAAKGRSLTGSRNLCTTFDQALTEQEVILKIKSQPSLVVWKTVPSQERLKREILSYYFLVECEAKL